MTTIPPEFACTNAECPIGCPPEHAYDPRVTFLTGNEAIGCGTFAELGGTDGVTLICNHAPFERIIDVLKEALVKIAKFQHDSIYHSAGLRCPTCIATDVLR